MAATLLGLACGESGPPPPSQPAGWNAPLAPPEAVDTSADPHVVEVSLDARVSELEIVPGKKTPCYTYGDRIPGPVIRAHVGDRLLVHFTNHLPDPTTIHWHGVRVPLAMDGVPGVSQEPVPPGGAFDYDFVVPDAGTFWYHPHVDSAIQVGQGMYGALIVTDPAEENDLGDELVLVLSDIGIDEDGVLFSPTSGGDLGTLFGREGNILLVNGRVNPTITVRAGLRQHWRVINASKSRYFQLAWEGQRFLRIGSDGGRIAVPQTTERVVLTAAQRAELLVEPSLVPGSTSVVRWVAYDRGFGSTFNRPDEPIFTVTASADQPASSPSLPALARNIAPWQGAAATAYAFSMNQAMAPDGHLTLNINDRTVADWEASPLPATVGDKQIWTIKNTVAFAHPFHLHGFFFQVLDDQERPVEPLEWRDTVDVPVDGTVRVGVSFDDHRPGMWMFHCHVLDHADAGMMGMLMLSEPGAHASH